MGATDDPAPDAERHDGPRSLFTRYKTFWGSRVRHRGGKFDLKSQFQPVLPICRIAMPICRAGAIPPNLTPRAETYYCPPLGFAVGSGS